MAWLAPIYYDDPSSAWTGEASVIEELDSTDYASDNVAAGSWSEYLELSSVTDVACTKIRFDVNKNGAGSGITTCEVDLYYDGGWNNVYSDTAHDDHVPYVVTLPSQKTVSSARLRLYNDGAGINDARIYSFAIYDAGGYEIVDRWDVSMTSTITNIYGNRWQSMPWTPTRSYTVKKTSARLFRFGSPGTVTFEIYATDGSHHPTGSALATGTASGNNLPTAHPGEFLIIDFGSGASLTAGTEYTIVLYAADGDSSNYIRWYLGGSYHPSTGRYYSNDGGSSWLTGGQDMAFRIYTTDIIDPEEALVSQWKMNDNAASSHVDDFLEANDGIASRNTSLLSATGHMNEALDLDYTQSDYLDMGQISAIDLTARQDSTVVIWAKVDSYPAANSLLLLWWKYYSTNLDGYILYYDRNNEELVLEYGNGSILNPIINVDIPYADMQSWRMITLRIDRTNVWKLDVDNGRWEGYDNSTATPNWDTDQSSSESWYVGRDTAEIGGAHNYWDGPVDQILVYDEVISDEVRETLWNDGDGNETFTGTAPTISAHPQSQTVRAYQNVTLSITASGDPAPTYQWYKDGSPIAGATSDTYQFVAESSDEGDYYCIATNVVGSAQSNTATITVIVEQARYNLLNLNNDFDRVN